MCLALVAGCGSSGDETPTTTEVFASSTSTSTSGTDSTGIEHATASSTADGEGQIDGSTSSNPQDPESSDATSSGGGYEDTSGDASQDGAESSLSGEAESESGTEGSSGHPGQLSFEELQSLLSSFGNDNLVTRVEEDAEQWYIHGENGDVVALPKGSIADVVDTPANWSVVIILPDGNSAELDRVGDDLPIADSDIEVDPFGTAPLSARLRTTTPVPGRFVVRVVGQDGPMSDFISQPSPFGQEHELTIMGLYADFENRVEVTFTDEAGAPRVSKTLNVPTAPLSSRYPTFVVEVPYTEEIPNNLIFLFNYTPLLNPVGADAFGKIRYTFSADVAPKRGVRKLQNGNLGFGVRPSGLIREYTWLGDLRNTWSIGPDYEMIHHDVYEMPNGNFLVTVDEIGADTIEDILLEIDREDGSIVTIWDMKDALQRGQNSSAEAQGDWFHMNAVIYDESDDTVIVSGAYQGIIKLTRNNEVRWILEPESGWSDEFLPYVLELQEGTIPRSNQHGHELMPNGNILMFENAVGVAPGTEERVSRIVEFEIDPNPLGGGTVRQVFEYGSHRPELFSIILSDADYDAATDRRIMTSGAIAVFVDPETSGLVWDQEEREKTRIVEVDAEGTVHFEIVLVSSRAESGASYRADKMILEM